MTSILQSRAASTIAIECLLKDKTSGLTHERGSTVGIHAVDRHGTGTTLEQELDDVWHVQPGSHTERGHVVDRVLGGVEREKGNVRVRNGDADDVEAVLRHEGRVGRVDGFPSADSDGNGEPVAAEWGGTYLSAVSAQVSTVRPEVSEALMSAPASRAS